MIGPYINAATWGVWASTRSKCSDMGKVAETMSPWRHFLVMARNVPGVSDCFTRRPLTASVNGYGMSQPGTRMLRVNCAGFAVCTVNRVVSERGELCGLFQRDRLFFVTPLHPRGREKDLRRGRAVVVKINVQRIVGRNEGGVGAGWKHGQSDGKYCLCAPE